MLDEVRKLEEAGWVLEEHLGTALWRRPKSGYLYPQEVAIALTTTEPAPTAVEDRAAPPAKDTLAESSSSAPLRSERALPDEEEVVEIVGDGVIVGGVIAVIGVTLMALSIWTVA
ncbi:MAG: hypothetical protein M3305_04970 [Actinomycetota bacterium]|nr:hypothetical protein [Actinomycetota bacterium]